MELTYLVLEWVYLTIDFTKDVSVCLFVVLISSYILREQGAEERGGENLLKYFTLENHDSYQSILSPEKNYNIYSLKTN